MAHFVCENLTPVGQGIVLSVGASGIVVGLQVKTVSRNKIITKHIAAHHYAFNKSYLQACISGDGCITFYTRTITGVYGTAETG